MKSIKKYISHIAFASMVLVGTSACSLDRFPESEFSDKDFWNTENDLRLAANRLYQRLEGFSLDNRADDNVNQNINQISNGTWSIPSTSDDWNNPYRIIFTANNILIKGEKATAGEAIKNRYLGEARFFRAYAYFTLLQKYGDVPLLLKTLDFDSPELFMGRAPKQEVAKQIYEDLDFATQWLPSASAVPADQYGRVSKSTAQALKARVALFIGTFGKYHNEPGFQEHLDVAVKSAEFVMGQGHKLFANYGQLFDHPGEGRTNTENILVKIYGVSSSNLILGHNYSRDMENGRLSMTRNFVRQYLYEDGLPAFNELNQPSSKRSAFFVAEGQEPSYNTVFEHRDPRLTYTLFKAEESAYKGPWVPTTTLGSRTAYATKKYFNLTDWQVNGNGTVDRILIRYGEVLLIYAEAKYEQTGSISDADLDRTVNALRARAGFNAKLTNTFAQTNQLSLLEEIRRERSVELALEGFRYTDILRWKLAEKLLTQTLLGAKYNAVDWVGADIKNLNLNTEQILIVEDASTRKFDPAKDYYYPVPLREISVSDGNVVQNPNWK